MQLADLHTKVGEVGTPANDITAAMSSSARNRAPSIKSGMSSRERAETTDYTMSNNPIMRYTEPCAATASMFLYAQGSSVVCCQHDTLTIERRFSSHSEEVQLLAVDNQSDLGRGRSAVSYDAGQTAIVWDLMTGEEKARFVSYEHITCAAWMQNGNVAFGNSQGSVILFEPTTSEHISSRTLDQIAVTALAPAADCRTFAIGYQNGSLLIANLQPRFTILYSLSTSRAPSPIVNLAWHASSSRGKSDMLAVQTHDGDLRVWSVAKSYRSDDPAKQVRILKRTENYMTGPNWMGWSKNGRIIQFSENETVSWDVRTKHVTNDRIPTLEHIRGLAVYGPAASLFTLGANGTVQQFDLNAPAMIVANVQHPANLLPPSPPISLEEQEKGANASNSESESIPIRMNADISAAPENHMSPLALLVQGGAAPAPEPEHHRAPSDMSSRSSISMSSTSSRTPGHRNYPQSVASRGMTENTYISSGSSMMSATPHRETHHRDRRDRDSRDSYSTSSLSSVSSHHRSRHQRPSRLRNEVVRSPEETAVQDLFKFTRSRLSDVPHKQPYMSDNNSLTNDDLRRQMLSTIFGWTGEVGDLIYDEMSRHPMGSTSRILLSTWLGDIDADSIAANSQNMTAADWMILALNSMGEASQQKVGRTYIHRLLKTGDVHTAATIMISLGDHNDAIEIYDTHKYYMEALILTCFIFPAVWERQEAIIKRWGEWAIQHSQQQLALRCMACTGKESSEPWTSPSAAQITFQSLNGAIPEMLSPPLSPPGLGLGPQRNMAKSASLKLITQFGTAPSAKTKYFLGGPDDGQTPIAAAATPIAESALSPGGYGDPSTAVLRPSQRSAFNTPASARPSHGFDRKRLPSIGETPTDSHPRELLTASTHRQDPYNRPGHNQQGSIDDTLAYAQGVARASTASPAMMRNHHKKKDPPPPSPSPQSLAALMEGPTRRNGSRTRIPNHLELALPPLDPGTGDVTSPEASEVSSTRHHWPSRRRGPASVASSVTSAASSVARSYRGHNAQGKSLDDYIHSLDAAQNANRARGRSRGRTRESSRTRKGESRERSHDRGRASSRTAFTPKGGPKRSPTSPIPMSPEDLINLATPKHDTSGEEAGLLIDISHDELPPSTVKKVSRSTRESSRPRASSRTASREGRPRSPDSRRPPALDLRGRSKARQGSLVRSPSSPLPITAPPMHFYGSDDDDDLRRAIEAKEKFRRKNGRSTSRSARDPASPGSVRDRTRDRSESRQRRGETKQRVAMPSQLTPGPTPGLTPGLTPGFTPAHAGDLKAMKDERQAKKEAAARELEERRKSLARRPSAPPIPHPDELFPTPNRTSPNAFFELPSTTFVPPKDLPTRSHTVEPGATRSMYASRGPSIGLPATPKAMRLVLESDSSKGSQIPVPPIPTTFAQASPPLSNHSNHSNHPSPARISPKKFEPEPEAASLNLTLLPQTVYSPPTRPIIPRSMSAPPEELVAPKGGSSHRRVSSRVQSMRKGSTDSNMIPEHSQRRPSYDDNIPPPPPPPPVLKELQHLALPPPPPPAPLPYHASGKPVVYGGQTSGSIEIVMDDDQPIMPPPPPPVPVAIPVSEATVPIIAPPAPPSSRNGHHRGRSSVDNSIAGRISRATERMRSASRSRTNTPALNRTKSPEISPPAPYESVPHLNFKARADQYRTGLQPGEMI